MPGDKSISHRALILGAIAEGITEIKGFLPSEDCLATAQCLRQMGIKIDIDGDFARVHGQGLHGLSAPKDVLYVGNSGTTLRLLTGLLSGQKFNSIIDGDQSIRKRPMDRVIIPLTEMGAKIKSSDGFAPIHITGSKLRGISYKMQINSAQVKSAIMLAGLYAEGKTAVQEAKPGLTRNHTEIMLRHMGKNVPRGTFFDIPGDFSSAAFFIVAGLLLADDGLLIENVGINPTRTGLLDALAQMGADIQLQSKMRLGGEDVADILVKKSPLKGIVLQGGLVARMIDEVPIFAVAAMFAKGVTIICDAQELAVKESNRIETVAAEFSKMGAKIAATEDGMVIDGGHNICAAVVDSRGDHRIAMSLAIAALNAQGQSVITNTECVNTSFPSFFNKIL